MVGNGQVVIADDTVEEKNSGITSRIDDINSNTEDNNIQKNGWVVLFC